MDLLQKAFEWSKAGFCVIFCKGKVPLENWRHLNPNDSRKEKDIKEAWDKFKSEANGISILIPQDWIVLDFDTKDKSFWEYFEDFAFQETKRGFHIPIIIKKQDLKRDIPKKLSEDIEVLQEKHPLLVCSLMDGRDWDVKELCKKILVIDDDVKSVSLRSFILSKVSLETQLEEIRRKDKKEAKNKLETKREKLLEWAKKEELVDYIMRLVGETPVKIGKSFKCILHEEKHPSASWYRTSSGEILYRDWHKRDGIEFYTLGEIYHAIITKETKKLKPFEKAKWLEKLIIDYLISQNKIQILFPDLLKLTKKISNIIDIFLNIEKQSTCNIKNMDIILQVDSQKKIRRNIKEKIFFVLDFLLREFYCSYLYGYRDVLVSERYLAKSLGLEKWEANRILNFLCVLGFFEKNGYFEEGDRITLGEVSFEEIKRRFEILFPDGKINLKKFNFQIVEKKLGSQIAEKTFRRIVRNKEYGGKEEISEIVLKEFKGKIL